MMIILICIACISSVRSVDKNKDFGKCKELSEPVGTHPRHGHEVPAGSLSVTQEGNDIIARTICDEDKGFILSAEKFREMRCSWDEKRNEWSWNHFHREKRTPPKVHCSRISPRPIVVRYALSPDASVCSNADDAAIFPEFLRDRLSASLPCAVEEQCDVTDVKLADCQLSVTVRPTALLSVPNQRSLLEAAVEFLQHITPDLLSSDEEPHSRHKRFGGLEPEDTSTGVCAVGEIESSDNCVQCAAGNYANADDTACVDCGYGAYSAAGSDECTDCSGSLDTLTATSDDISDCVVVCTVPTVLFTVSTNPEAAARTEDGSSVTINCNDTYA